MELRAVILAAGQGTRMKSDLPKVLHRVCGKPMVEHVIAATRAVGVERPVVVIGHGADQVKATVKEDVAFVLQSEQKGTGHAVLQTRTLFEGYRGDLLELFGDAPLLTPATLESLVRFHREGGFAATMLTATVEDPTGYGRVIRDGATGHVARVVEQKDASEAEKAVREINTGIFCFRAPELFEALAEVQPNNAQKEYYLGDVLPILQKRGMKVGALAIADPFEGLGVNSRAQLAEAEKILRRRKARALMDAGVTIVDPDNTYIDLDVEVGRDAVIYPFTFLEGRTKVGSLCRIGPSTRLVDTILGARVEAAYSVLLEARVEDDVTIGPFAYLRPGTVVQSRAKIGDFVELKKSVVGEGSKVPHLSYIGDSTIGRGVNIGAGTITCNYDGVSKHPTFIGDDVFIGSNSNLVAPVKVGDGAYVAAGSTITKDVPPAALGIGRARQQNIDEWARRRRKEHGEDAGGTEGAGDESAD
ncbi:MAG: bifunctional UDP-N-acetylglucosamine diphosphorylase/glucosamine-1-phosphate N-acetyltransferase GlmU [Syntrophothermus sp.]